MYRPDGDYTDADLERDMRALARLKGFGPLTPEQAEAAFDAADPEPISQERSNEIVRHVTGEGAADESA